MKTLLFSVFITLSLYSFNVDTQLINELELNSNQTYFVQFKINTLSSNKDAVALDKKMRANPSIAASRTDFITGTYFCILQSNVIVNQNDFEKWFDEMGYKITCFTFGIQGVDHITPPIDLKNCPG